MEQARLKLIPELNAEKECDQKEFFLPLDQGCDSKSRRNNVDESAGTVIFSSVGKVNFGDSIDGNTMHDRRNEALTNYGISSLRAHQ